MNYIIFVVLWGISQADAQTLTADVAAAHGTINTRSNELRTAIKKFDPLIVESIFEESKKSFIAVVEAFVNTLPVSDDTQVNLFTAELRENLQKSVEIMFTIDYSEWGVQNTRRQFQQALRTYINLPSSTFDVYKLNANSDAKLIMENLVKRAIDEALSTMNNLKRRLSASPSQ